MRARPRWVRITSLHLVHALCHSDSFIESGRVRENHMPLDGRLETAFENGQQLLVWEVTQMQLEGSQARNVISH